MKQKTSIEQRFSSGLFRIHQAYNLLDLNLGLCIRHLESPDDVVRSHEWLANSNVKTKIDRFKDLASQYLDDLDLSAWVAKAHQARLDRNLFTHAYFSALSQDEQHNQEIRVHPWMRPKLGIAENAGMTIMAFEKVVEEVETVFNDFLILRRKAGI